MRIARQFTRLVVMAAFLALAACESAEERAEEHYQEGLALLEAGDVERALVEFRNVFQLNGLHREARRTYAEVEMDRGNVSSAYGQYLRLVEQYPEDFAARKALLKIALPAGNWEEVERHLQPAADMRPEDPVVRLGQIALGYREAIRNENMEEASRLAEEAEALKEELPESNVLYEITINNLVREGEYEKALEQVESALSLSPDDLSLYRQRLALLERLGRTSDVEAQLRQMIEEFPDNVQIRASLIRWYLSRGDREAAEAFLRERIDDPDTGLQARVDLIQFLASFEGTDAALAELDRMIENGVDDLSFLSMRAGLRFEAGDRDAAIAELTRLVESAEPSDELRTMKIGLAKMLRATGNEVGARAQVEEVLDQDPTNVEGLKMRASWLIDQDQTDEAIVALRSALDQSPRDPEALTLMARAHERAGSRELMGEMLSLAMEASNDAPEETLRYVRFLRSRGNFAAAETALTDALRLAPNDVGLLRALGSLYIARSDYARARRTVEGLSNMDSQRAQAAANALQASLLAARDQTSDVVSFLEDLVEQGEGGPGARVAIIRTYVEEGNIEAARGEVEEALAESPDDPTMRFLAASLDQLEGDVQAAEEVYRTLVEERSHAPTIWRALYLLQLSDGRPDEARETLEAALEANPDSLDLLWAKASRLQQQGEAEAAIEVYERMYELNSNTPVVANNLASLLTTARDDPESLERAYSVARRLRNSDVPAFQDTFGWIAYRRGEYEDALTHLEPAAEGLPQDPLTQYHLAKTYQALDRPDAALEQFRAAVEAAGEDSDLAQIDEARERIAELTAQVSGE